MAVISSSSTAAASVTAATSAAGILQRARPAAAKACCSISLPSPSLPAFLSLAGGPGRSLIAAGQPKKGFEKCSALPIASDVATASVFQSTRSQSTEIVGKPTILVAEKLGEAGLELLRRIANVDFSYNLSQEDLCSKMSLCDALIVRSGTKVTQDVFESSKGRLKVVGVRACGRGNR